MVWYGIVLYCIVLQAERAFVLKGVDFWCLVVRPSVRPSVRPASPGRFSVESASVRTRWQVTEGLALDAVSGWPGPIFDDSIENVLH